MSSSHGGSGKGPYVTRTPRERVIVCGAIFPGHPRESEGELTEIKKLATAANADVVGDGIVQHLQRAHAATLLGRGKVAEIKEEIDNHDADAVVVDNDLSPAQVRNLEKAWCVRVIDRSEIILDIFARRAKTRQARLQVELAQNEYLLPRLRRMWTHLERTEGAIGTRGPGETQLETDKRLLRKRVHDLRHELKEIEARRVREMQSRSQAFTVGLVGYTNAGKSTILNRLTDAEVLAADMLFATLDTRTRRWKLADGRVVLLSDTVGFLQRLPHHLVASFHATLEETLYADLLLHVVDASHPDAGHQMRAVNEVLSDMSSGERSTILIFNKIDQVEDRLELQLLRDDPTQEVVEVSAATGVGFDELEAAVTRHLDSHSALLDVTLPLSEGKLQATLRGLATVQEEEVVGEESLRMRVRITEGAYGAWQREAHGRAEVELLEAPTDGASLHGFGAVHEQSGRPEWS